MSVGEYVAVFVSIILGIAFGDLALSTHRLLRARKRVEWHWATPVLAVFMLMNIVAFWWASFNWYRTLGEFSIGEFLPDVALFVLLFLAVAAVMPDDVPDGRFSLKEFYFREATYFWAINILTVIVIIVHVGQRDEARGDWRAVVGNELENIFMVLIMLPLLVTKRAWYHYLVIAIILVLVGGDYLVETIEA